MTSIICLDENYSTTRLVAQEKPEIVNNSSYQVKTVLFLPEGEKRQDEGGLRTKGYFKKSYENKPLISIITVVFNGEQYLEQTIQSVINQTYDNIEYTIIDGYSNDRTLEIIKKYDDVIDYWVSEPDKGIYYAMNKGIQIATGEFIAFINADDWYEKEAIKHITTEYNKNKHIDFFYGNLNYIKENGKVVLWKGNRGEKGLEIPHPTCFIRSSILKQHLFNTDFKIAADVELILRLCNLNIKSFYVDEVITSFRDGGISSNFWKTQKETFCIVTKYIGFYNAATSFLKKAIIKSIKTTKFKKDII